jgi:hypothetical protein
MIRVRVGVERSTRNATAHRRGIRLSELLPANQRCRNQIAAPQSPTSKQIPIKRKERTEQFSVSEIALITEVTRTRFGLTSLLTPRTAKMGVSFFTVPILLLVVQLPAQQAPAEPPTVSAILQRIGSSKIDLGEPRRSV